LLYTLKVNELKNKSKVAKRIISTFISVFVLINLIAIFHSYKFTHFKNKPQNSKTAAPTSLTIGQKISILAFGISNPRPENIVFPVKKYETIDLNSNKRIECWYIKCNNPKGTVILFHGYGGNKSSMLDKAAIFNSLGYHTLLVDFMGSGGSEGNQTTIGFFEADQVRTCFDYLQKKGEQHIYLFGTSMGAVAIMKAISDFDIHPKGIIIECPFGSMYQTVCARFKIMNVPTFPMAALLVFWGGIQNGFWAFGHNPTSYAKKINCPILLLYGQKDEKVSKREIDEIFTNLKGVKQLKTYPEAAHENYLIKYHNQWTIDVTAFLAAN